MRNALKMLKVVWPESIPAADYAKALEVIATAEASKPRTSTKPTPAPKPKVEQTNGEKVLAVLATGPATAREIAEVTGLSLAEVKYALTQVAVSSGSRPNPNGFGIAANLYTAKKGV